MKGMNIILTIVLIVFIFLILSAGCAQADLNRYDEIRCFNTLSFWVGSLSASIIMPVFIVFMFRNFKGTVWGPFD